MKAKELMDKEFIYVSKNDSVVEVSKTMEKIKRHRGTSRYATPNPN